MQIGLRYYFFFRQSIPIINGYHCPSRVHILYMGLWCSRGLSPKLIIIIIIAQTVLCRKGVVNATRSPNDSSRAEKHGSKISKKGFRFVKKGRSSNTHTKKKNWPSSSIYDGSGNSQLSRIIITASSMVDPCSAGIYIRIAI